jgi:protein Tex
MTWETGGVLFQGRSEQGRPVSKFEMYYDYREPLRECPLPPHAGHAPRREGGGAAPAIEAPEGDILLRTQGALVQRPSIFPALLEKVAEDAYKRLIAPSIEVELRLEAKQQADEAAIAVFAENLRNLLLLPPAGGKRVLGVDPGLRTGSKLAAVDGTGRFLEHVTIYPHAGEAG